MELSRLPAQVCRQDTQQVGHGDLAGLHPEGEEHGVAGEQLGAGDDN